MASLDSFETIAVSVDDFVATIQIQRPPNNFFTVKMIGEIADTLETLDQTDACRASVLCSQGKHFCAGNDFAEARYDVTGQADGDANKGNTLPLYAEATRLFKTRKPIVAAVQGAAIGGGLGLSLVADFRVAAPEARFSANFAMLGYHHGFGISVTLPRVVGIQQANLLLFTGRRIKGEEAYSIGLCDYLVRIEEVRERALALAREIASAAPLSVEAVRETMRQGLAKDFARATAREAQIQFQLRDTKDFREGIAASKDRRTPDLQTRVNGPAN